VASRTAAGIGFVHRRPAEARSPVGYCHNTSRCETSFLSCKHVTAPLADGRGTALAIEGDVADERSAGAGWLPGSIRRSRSP